MTSYKNQSDRFIQRGYAEEWVKKKAYEIALKKPRSELLKKSKRKDKKFSVTCITSYSPHSHTIRPVFKKTLTYFTV